MPRFVKTSNLTELIEAINKDEDSRIYQLDKFQQQWCHITKYEIPDRTAVLSYRWRSRVANETVDSYYNWVRYGQSVKFDGHPDHSGGMPLYAPLEVETKAREMVDTLNKSPVALDVLLWMLWIANTGKYDYIWVDQFCVPQDWNNDDKMEFIRDSPRIYNTGHVFILIAPNTCHGHYIQKEDVDLILSKAKDLKIPPQMFPRAFTEQDFQTATKYLVYNLSYFSRVWTIQEMAMTKCPQAWPVNNSALMYRADEGLEFGGFDLLLNRYFYDPSNSFKEILHSKPIFNRNENFWLQFLEGNYSPLLEFLEKASTEEMLHPFMFFLAVSATTPPTRLSLIGQYMHIRSESNENQDAYAAFEMLNSFNVLNSRCFSKDDIVFATIPLIDREKWAELTQGLTSQQAYWKSLDWAYEIAEKAFEDFANRDFVVPTSFRIWVTPEGCGGLSTYSPRRYYNDGHIVKETQAPTFISDSYYKFVSDVLIFVENQIVLGDGTILTVEEKLVAGFLSESAIKPLLDNNIAFLEEKCYETLNSIGNDYYDHIVYKDSMFQTQHCMYFLARGPTGKVHVLVALPLKESFVKAKAILMMDIIAPVSQEECCRQMKDIWSNHKGEAPFAFDQDIEFV